MALNKHWILNDNFQPLFKIDFDAESSDYEYLGKLNGGIAYGVENPIEYPQEPYFGRTPFLVKKLTEPLTDFKSKVNSIILGTNNNTGISAQDNQVIYLDSWGKNLYNFFISDEQFQRKEDINYCLPYGIGDASKESDGYWYIDFKIKTSEYYDILKYIKDDINNFKSNCISYAGNPYDNCIYIGHIGGLYEYLNQYYTDFDLNVFLLDTKTGSKKCIPILWWNCITNGVARLNSVSGTTNATTNRRNLYFADKSCLYYNKLTGMCIFIFLNNGVLLNNTTRFDALKNFLLRCVELQARVGYITL